jgi:hypothetical protein
MRQRAPLSSAVRLPAMQLNLRELMVLMGLAAIFCVCFLIEPDWNVTEAHRLCDGKSTQVFDSMAACAIGQQPGCTCMRPVNPWAYAFWLVALSLIGIAASVFLRSDFLPAAAPLIVALAAGGTCALFLLSRRESYDEEAWLIGKVVVAVYIAFVMVVFALARSARHWTFTMRRR